MAPAGVFWAAARARVAFCCARGKGGGAMVLLGAKEGGKELGQGRNVGGGRERTVASSGAHGLRGSGRLKRTRGGKGGGLGAGGARH